MKKLIAPFFLSVLIFSCKDDDPKITVEAALTSATNGWVFEKILVIVPGTTTQVDAMTTEGFSEDFDEECERDNATIFKTDKSFTIANNTKCDSGEEDTLDAGIWSLSSDQTSLTIDSADEPGTGDAIILTNVSTDGEHIQGELASLFGLPIEATVIMKKK
jgi:hypothetical protein